MAGSTEIGTAYLRVKAKMDGSFESELASAGARAGGGFGGAFQVAIGNILSSAAERAVTVIGGALKDAFSGYADYEQLVGGVGKIFDQMDTSRIFADAQNAYKELNLSANEYMATINQTGAVFAATMGDERGYDAARRGMLAVSDYATGTGRDINELSEKFALISRSSQGYQSIADQFSGILPQTSQSFLEQAQAAGLLSDKYTSLTEVPIDEYQQALIGMMEQGVDSLGLTGNTLEESTKTISGSLAMLKSAWADFLVGIFDENSDMDALVGKLVESLQAAFNNVMPALQRAAVSLFSVIPDALMQVLDEYFPGASDAIGRIVDAFRPAVESMRRMGEEIGPMVGPMLQDLADVAGEVLVPALERLGEGCSYFMEQLEPWMPHIMNVVDILGQLFIVTLAATIDIIAAVANIFGTVLEALMAFCDGVEAAPAVIGGFADSVGQFFGNVRDDISGALESAKSAIGNWADDLKSKGSIAMGSFKSTVSSGFSSARSMVESALSSIRSNASTSFSSVVSTAHNAMSTMRSTTSGVWSSITSSFHSGASSIQNAMSTAQNAVGNAISSISSRFSSVVSTVQDAMSNAASAVDNAVSSISSAFSNISISFPYIPLPHFSWHWEDVGGFLWIPQFDGIQWYGHGGFVDEATLFGAGERGGEFVWPGYEPELGRYADAIAKRMDGGKGGVDIHDNTFIVRRDDDIRRVAVELNTLINRQTEGGIA